MFVNCSKKDQAETHNSFKKGPGHVLTLLEYNIPSKKDQAETHNSFKKGPGYVLTLLEYNIPSKKDQAETHNSFKKGPSHDTELPQKRTRLLLKCLPKTLISHADRMYRLRVVFYKISQKLGIITRDTSLSRSVSSHSHVRPRTEQGTGRVYSPAPHTQP